MVTSRFARPLSGARVFCFPVPPVFTVDPIPAIASRMSLFAPGARENGAAALPGVAVFDCLLSGGHSVSER
jgi:hypothetical protein